MKFIETMHKCYFVVGFSQDGIHIIKDIGAEHSDVTFQEFLQRLTNYSSNLEPIKSFSPLIRLMSKKVNLLKSFL
jgi:hypothetical protein